jgi:uncharacterized membrane protein YphA (DoxX/SURF4 family)
MRPVMSRHGALLSPLIRIGSILVLLAILAAIYWLLIRPRLLRWGATAAELQSSLPEDDIVANPAFDATRAIAIRARPEEIWPWLVQMGYGRAGFYGYDLIENLGGGRGLRSATTILPQFQNPRTGHPLPLSVAASLQFGAIDPNRTLVWQSRDHPPTGVFIWALRPIDAANTRLISRIRWRYLSDPQGRALGIFTEFTDHVAVRAILEGVRDRVEGRPPRSLALQAVQIAAWLLALGEFAAAVLLVLSARQWQFAWLLALGFGFVVFFVLYAPAPGWCNAILVLAGLFVLLRTRNRFKPA